MKMFKRPTPGDLMLLELICAIVFFCLTIAAAMSVFGNAYEMSSVAVAQNMAVRESGSAAEIIRSSDTEEEAKKLLIDYGFTPDGDSEFEKLYGDDKYRMSLSLSREGKLLSARITCFYNNSELKTDAADPVFDLDIRHAVKED